MKTMTFVEYQGKKIDADDIVDNAKRLWTSEGNKIKDIKSLNLYVKPEEDMVYYVVNEEYSGQFKL